MRRLFVNGVVAVVVAAAVGVGAGGTAHAVTLCSGDITGQTINGSVLAQGNCESSGNTHISGDLSVSGRGHVVFQGTNNTVGGRLRIASSAGGVVCGTTILGAVNISDNDGSVGLGPNACGSADTIEGGVDAIGNRGAVLLFEITIAKNVRLFANAGGEVKRNVIAGNLVLDKNRNPFEVSGNTVAGTCNNEGTRC